MPKIQVARSVATALVALSIWMNDTLRYRYAKLPQIKLRLNMTPMGTIARPYVCGVMGTLWRESSVDVKRARIWVMIVAKTMCHVVRNNAAELENNQPS